MSLEDQAVQVRQGEELDNATVKAFLSKYVDNTDGDLEITQFPGGASNLTYQLSVGGEQYILRRPPFGNIAKGAHDMLREANIMDALKPVYQYVPNIIAKCDDHDVLGCDFYIMEKFKGIIPRKELPEELNLSEEDTRKLCLNVVDKLIDLHKVDPKAAGLDSLGKGDGYVARQINGWTKWYVKALTPDATSFEEVMDWLKANMPNDVAQCLIHNDFRFDNVVLDVNDPLKVIGVLDWEMATIGDPLMDLGNSLAYWIQADDDEIAQSMRIQPTHLPGMLTRQEVVEYYLEKTGYKCESFTFYEVYGMFRLAVIMQQIYKRYYEGLTKDPRFASFADSARYLEQRCLKLIKGE